jgi:hypothetical protein
MTEENQEEKIDWVSLVPNKRKPRKRQYIEVPTELKEAFDEQCLLDGISQRKKIMQMMVVYLRAAEEDRRIEREMIQAIIRGDESVWEGDND